MMLSSVDSSSWRAWSTRRCTTHSCGLWPTSVRSRRVKVRALMCACRARSARVNGSDSCSSAHWRVASVEGSPCADSGCSMNWAWPPLRQGATTHRRAVALAAAAPPAGGLFRLAQDRDRRRTTAHTSSTSRAPADRTRNVCGPSWLTEATVNGAAGLTSRRQPPRSGRRRRVRWTERAVGSSGGERTPPPAPTAPSGSGTLKPGRQSAVQFGGKAPKRTSPGPNRLRAQPAAGCR